MNHHSRKLFLKLATIVTAAVVALLPAAALAAPYVVTSNANVRVSPGGPVIGTLVRGTVVEVEDCSNWCRLAEGGWVSATLLRRAGPGPVGGSPDVGVGVSIGAGGISIGIGSGRPPVVDDDDDEFGEVCFYSRTRYRGDSFCMEEGESIRRLGADWNDEISSIENPDGLRVTVCIDRNYSDCRIYTSSARSLGGFDDEISSIRVRF